MIGNTTVVVLMWSVLWNVSLFKWWTSDSDFESVLESSPSIPADPESIASQLQVHSSSCRGPGADVKIFFATHSVICMLNSDEILSGLRRFSRQCRKILKWQFENLRIIFNYSIIV